VRLWHGAPRCHVICFICFALAIGDGFSALSAMDLPNQPISFKAEQIEELNRKLAHMRHDINNMLSLIIAAVELIRSKPHMTESLVTTLLEQPPRITASMAEFSTEFERAFGIERRE